MLQTLYRLYLYFQIWVNIAKGDYDTEVHWNISLDGKFSSEGFSFIAKYNLRVTAKQ